MKSKIICTAILDFVVVFGIAGCSGLAETNNITENSSFERITENVIQDSKKDIISNTMEEENAMTENEMIQVPEWEPVEIPQNSALAFVESMQLGWNLGNTFDASNCGVAEELEYESAWVGVTTTKEMIQTIANAGFRTIRIPVSWHNHVDEDFQISKVWLDRIQEVVDWAIAEDLYMIINIHHDNEEGFMYPSYDYLEHSKQYVQAIWQQLSERFAEYNENQILFPQIVAQMVHYSSSTALQ